MSQDDAIRDWDDFWPKFNTSDPAGQLELARTQVRELDAFDGDWAAEIIKQLAASRFEPDQLGEVLELLEEMRETHPDAVATQEPWMTVKELVIRLQADATVDDGLVADIVEAMPEDPDTIFRALTVMMYHGLGEPMIDPMLSAWPDVARDDAVMPWAKRRFAWRALTLVLIDAVADDDDLDETDADLWDRLAPLTVDEMRDSNERLIRHFAGRPDTPVSEVDTSQDLEALRDEVMMQVATFTGWLRDEAGWSTGRSALAFTVVDEFFRRALTDRLSDGEARYQVEDEEGDEKDEDVAAVLDDASVLVPSPAIVDAYLDVEYEHLLTSSHQGVTLITALDHWLDYLADQDVLGEDEAATLSQAIDRRLEGLVERLELATDDRRLVQDLRDAIDVDA
jgi:Asp-tRNA(Asn)/Glu-tRNA(Gln) amidotransferase C subunit